jgi:monoamine oxidase
VATGQLGRLFGECAAQPTSYLEQDWTVEPWSRGAYSALFPPGAWTHLGTALRRPAGRIHWAGTETATRWYGYIEGAIRSADRVADEITSTQTGGLPRTFEPDAPT